MSNFEKPTTPEEQSEQLSAPEQNNVPEQGPEDEFSPEFLRKKFAQQDTQSNEVIKRTNKLLNHIDGIDDEEPEVTEKLNKETGGFLKKIGKIKALRNALTLLALLAPAAAQAGTLDAVKGAVAQTQEYNKQHTTHNTALEYINAQKAQRNRMIITKNGRLKPKTMHGDAHLNSVLETLRGAQNLHEQVLLNDLKGVKFGTTHVNKLNAVPIRLHRMGEKYPTVNSLGNIQHGMLRKNRGRLDNIHNGEIYGNNKPSHVKFQSYNNVDSDNISADPTSDVGISSIGINNNR